MGFASRFFGKSQNQPYCDGSHRDTDITPVITEIEESHDAERGYPNLSVAQIQKAMGGLPVGFRVVLTLYLFEGYDHKEVSQILGISESASKSLYSKAKQKIREILKSPKPSKTLPFSNPSTYVSSLPLIDCKTRLLLPNLDN